MTELTTHYIGIVNCFSSRRRHARYWRDWSSDVCSSDLIQAPLHSTAGCQRNMKGAGRWCSGEVRSFWVVFLGWGGWRSEERRVGKSVDLGGRRILKINTKSQRV